MAAVALALAPASASAQAIIPDADQHKNVSFLRDDTVTIADAFSPFGNTLDVAKFGDDGSRVLTDLSGVLIWSDSSGEFREVPNTELATPVYVTNNELIVWQNRYVDFANYGARPDLELVLYRLDAQGAIVATDLNVQGKELLETSKITTSTGSMVVATTERIDGNGGAGTPDQLIVRVYRVTFTGAVQRIGTFNDGAIPFDSDNFGDTQVGPQVESLGYGSDGSLLFRYPDLGLDTHVWMNSTGVSRELALESGGAISRVISVANKRLVTEEDAGGKEVYDYRRSQSDDTINADPAQIAVTGDVLGFGNLTVRGNTKYFYTRQAGTPDLVRTYELTDDSAAFLGGVGVDIGDAEVVKINPADGSAVIQGSGSDLVWLFATATTPGNAAQRFIQIPNTDLATPMYVTNDECIIWTNARAPIPEGGVPDPAMVEHLVRDAAGTATLNTQLILDGTYLLDTQQFVPGFDYWSLATAEKIAGDSSLMRTYALSEQGLLDTDSDGLLDTEEALIGTDPADPDTDNDGLTDGEEVNPFSLVAGTFDWAAARVDAQEQGGDLLTITDDVHPTLGSTKYQRVESRLGTLLTRYWIGGHDTRVEGDFEWVSEEPFVYTNWAAGQPDNLNNSDAIELLVDYTWNDARLDEQKGYVLELPATNPLLTDTDGDGLNDGSEVNTHKTDPTVQDTDGDGYTDSEEVINGTDPLNAADPKFVDSDGDGLTDELEIFPPAGTCATSPTNPDSDGDGLLDGEEINTYGTNPCNPDTDGDGVSDGDEVANGTDPTVPSFGNGGGGTLVDFTDSDVYGTYAGIVYEAGNVPVGYMTLKVSKKGGFSGKLMGYGKAKSNMKGKYDALGHYSGEQYNADGLSSNADMNIAEGSYGLYRIGGTLVPYTGGDRQFFNLTRVIYSKSETTDWAGAYTWLTPSETVNDPAIPAGDGIAAGTITADGKVKFKGYSNHGNKYSYSGNVLEGDTIAFFAQPKNNRVEAVIGLLRLNERPGESDIEGSVRHSQLSGGTGSPYAAGYDEELDMIGSRYDSAGFVQIPADGFDVIANNALASFIGGYYEDNFYTDSYVFTWESRGKMTAPKLPTYSTSAKMKNKTGMFTGKYIFKDANDRFTNSKTTLRGVVIQTQDLVSGHAINNQSSSRYVVVPNEGGDVAPSVSVTPKSKKVGAAETSYLVQITLPDDVPWEVEIPDTIDWVQVTPATGTGSGTVTVTVLENKSELWVERESKIRIAGVQHKITQDYSRVGIDDLVITPRSQLVVSSQFTSYSIEVTASPDLSWQVEIPANAQEWVYVDPAQGTGSAQLAVTVGPLAAGTRETTIFIGNKPHDVVQWSVE